VLTLCVFGEFVFTIGVGVGALLFGVFYVFGFILMLPFLYFCNNDGRFWSGVVRVNAMKETLRLEGHSMASERCMLYSKLPSLFFRRR